MNFNGTSICHAAFTRDSANTFTYLTKAQQQDCHIVKICQKKSRKDLDEAIPFSLPKESLFRLFKAKVREMPKWLSEISETQPITTKKFQNQLRNKFKSVREQYSSLEGMGEPLIIVSDCTITQSLFPEESRFQAVRGAHVAAGLKFNRRLQFSYGFSAAQPLDPLIHQGFPIKELNGMEYAIVFRPLADSLSMFPQEGITSETKKLIGNEPIIVKILMKEESEENPTNFSSLQLGGAVRISNPKDALLVREEQLDSPADSLLKFVFDAEGFHLQV